jgi:hypothetical protein
VGGRKSSWRLAEQEQGSGQQAAGRVIGRQQGNQATGQLVDGSIGEVSDSEGEGFESTQFVESRVGGRNRLVGLNRRIGQKGKDKGGES